MTVTQAGVVFDVDGTLVDTNFLHTLAWYRGLHDTGEHAPMATIHRLIGMSSQRVIEELLGDDRADVSEAHSRHFETLSQDVRIFPGAAELLQEVHRRGAKVLLATSAKKENLDAFRDTLGAEVVIDHVVSSADITESKPSPEIFELALRVSDLERNRAIVVGDTVWDVEAARRCGLDCVSVLTGGNCSADLAGAGAVAVYEDVAELLHRLDDSPIGALLASSAEG